MSINILELSNCDKNDVNLCGGKGSSLGELIKLGMNVPDGFIITTNAYRNPDRKISTSLKKEILDHFKKLDTEFVAVRSSAIAEDSSKMAWAGQLSTYLYTTRSNLIQNIKNCWNSINSPRAKAYKKLHGLGDVDIAVAVVVQKMVPSEVSGIAFTAHPVTKDKNIILIEAIYGLGEAIVSGSVTPDSYIVDKLSFNIHDVEIVTQEKMLVKGPEGIEENLVPIASRNQRKLTENKTIELAKLCKTIEEHYGKPQDIEWCLKDNELFILQSRPITA